MKEFRVWHISQVPMQSFTVEVDSPLEGRKVMDILARYDLFQYDTNIKPDFSNASRLDESNASGLDEWDIYEQEWSTWYDDDRNDIDSYSIYKGILVLDD